MAGKIYGLNLENPNPNIEIKKEPARVAIFALASDYGCQLQITNVEDHLLEVLGTFELVYWQLVSSDDVPEDYDIAIIEGAVCTAEHEQLVRDIRARAQVVIAIGACAITGGVPGMASDGQKGRLESIYGVIPAPAADFQTPRPVSDFIDIDFLVPGCPIESLDFIAVLQRALLGCRPHDRHTTMCGSCRLNENECFLQNGVLCLGLVTRSGCDARCVAAGRPCNGCRGLSDDANIASARTIVEASGLDVAEFDKRLEIFSTAALAKQGDEEADE
jgi:sulfhydrogenase subunit delta